LKKAKVCVLDYGSGNVKSVYNVLKHLGHNVVVSNEKLVIKNCSHLILPGVGSFGSAMKKITAQIPMDCLEHVVLNGGKPFLGICVGMQILADEGNEFSKVGGLGWIGGSVNKLSCGDLALPHVGWNDISINQSKSIFEKLKDHKDFYFVHSYAFDVNHSEHILAYTDYGNKFVSVVNKENIYGFQFHPEKSQRAGQLMLNNFIKQK
jgi:imidazole glycerol-phosphate synthase subunit HisH